MFFELSLIIMPYTVIESIVTLKKSYSLFLFQTYSISRATVDGIDFNISKIPDAVTLDDTSGNSASFMLRNKALPDPADVHIEVVSEDFVRRIDYNDERYKETYLAVLNGKAIGCDYLIRDESDNDIAWVNAHFTNGVYPYQVSITGLSGGTASLSVDFYYRDVLLKRTKCFSRSIMKLSLFGRRKSVPMCMIQIKQRRD